MLSSNMLPWAVTTKAAEQLIAELEGRFPSSSLMDAFGFVYPQYWLRDNAESDFDKHLAVIKEHYGVPKQFALPKKGGASLPDTDSHTVPADSGTPPAPLAKGAKGKEALPVLSIQKLEE